MSGEKPPRPERVEPDYPEREQLDDEPHSNPRLRAAANWRKPTREIPLEQVTREVRAIVKQRSLWRSLAGVGTLLFGGSSLFGIHTHGHAESLQEEVGKLRDQLTEARIKLAACCQKGDEP